ncbi:MAG: hypothetical protein R2762_30790 [Bryobacteraceae bacterium]
MAKIRLIHWHPGEAERHAARLRDAGHTVDASVPTPANHKTLRDAPVDAYLISLDRLPSHGQAIAMMLRQSKASRHIPILFVGGLEAKVERVRQLLPDAVFTSWSRAAGAIAPAVERPPAKPLSPAPFQAYAATPLPAKLGIGPGARIALLNPPPAIAESLGDLPSGATFIEWRSGPCDVLLWFVRSRAELESEIEWIAAQSTLKLWILWPKRASGVATDLAPSPIRAAAQRCGLTDYKICSFDKTWSGMALGPRRTAR